MQKNISDDFRKTKNTFSFFLNKNQQNKKVYFNTGSYGNPSLFLWFLRLGYENHKKYSLLNIFDDFLQKLLLR